jgi:uncharacterized protein (TIGR03086 family)
VSPAEQHAYDAERFLDLARGAAPGDWERPSPVDGWTARDVVAHLVDWFPGFLSSGAGIELPAVPAVTEDPVAAWEARTADVQKLAESPGDRVVTNPHIGEIPLAQAIDQFYTNDVWMHRWDLAMALGREPDLGEERCAAALAAMEPMEEMLRSSGQYGPRVEVPASASAQDRFVGFIGRDPSWRPPA